ncbi:MAG: DNA translocase FtsK [Clostridiaceae bacterium]|nr:DNA translocase FtsK [Clostridiaceae bacterium]
MKVKKVQKKKFKKRSGISRYNNEIIGIVILAFGVLVSLSLYFENSIGMFGSFVRDLIFGLIGPPGYVVPPLIIFYSVLLIFKKNSTIINSKLLYVSILILTMSAIIQTGSYKEAEYENMDALRCIIKFYNDGSSFHGGGILGGIISMPFLLVFKNLGTIVILTTASIIVIILITNISIAMILTNFKRSVAGLFMNMRESLQANDKVVNINNTDKKVDNKVPDKAVDHKALFEKDDADEPDIVMNGRKLPKILDFNLKKASRDNRDKNPEADHDEGLDHEAPDTGKVDKKVKELKKDDISSKDVDKISESVNKEISHKQKLNFDYKYPHTGLLQDNDKGSGSAADFRNSAIKGAKKLEETLKSFGVDAKVVNVSMGPAVTRYELQPSPGVKVSKIVNLSDDISLNLAASGVRIEAPIPGKAAIGIEVPNKEVVAVFLKDVIESKSFKDYPSKLAFALGKDISGQSIVTDIGKMPHLLVAGATGSGKSVCINSLIVSLLFKASPNDVKLLMVDPKVVELGIYNGIPHLLIPVVTDPKKAAGALNWAVQEMVNRYKLFADSGVRDLKGYNAMIAEKAPVEGAEQPEPLPQIVIIIDELADLMMVAPNDVEDAICRLAQMARAAGMHLVIATQRPSVDVITGVIKANIPSRIAFAVSSQVDSRTILDMAGAEKLLGKGDMLFYPVGEPKPIRVKGAFVSDKEVENIVEYIKQQGNAEYNEDIIEEINSEREQEQEDSGDNDELLPQAIELVVDAGQASVSLIQRKFKVGYARAARIVDQMEARGVVGGYEGSKPRQVLISKQQWHELNMKSGE